MLQNVARESKFKMWLSQIASYISLNNILSMIVLKRVSKLCQRPMFILDDPKIVLEVLNPVSSSKIVYLSMNMIINNAILV